MNLLERYYLEERRVTRIGRPELTDIPCCECGQLLIRTGFVLGFRFMCDNHECSLFREGQGSGGRKIELTNHRSRTWRPCYQEELEKAKRNYNYLCKAGIRSVLAATHKSDKQTQRIRGMIKRGVSREFINRALAGKHDN